MVTFPRPRMHCTCINMGRIKEVIRLRQNATTLNGKYDNVNIVKVNKIEFTNSGRQSWYMICNRFSPLV